MPKRPVLVEVHWDDAVGCDGWRAPEPDMHGPIRVVSAGVLLKEDKAGVSLTIGRADDGAINGFLFVPRACIVKVHRLKRAG